MVGLGLAAGVLGGLLGIGGAAMIIPGLVLLAGFSQHRAHGTSLAVVLFMSLAGVLTYSRFGYMDWRASAELAAGGIVGAGIGARIVGRITGTVLRRMFCVLLTVVGARMILAGYCETTCVAASTWFQSGLAHTAATVIIGLAAGVLSSIFGIGGGMVVVPAMVLLLCAPQKTAQGVSLAAILPTALTGMLLHGRMGNVDHRSAALVGLGGLVGAFAGACLANCLASAALQLAFGVFLVLMSALLFFKGDSASER
jgi:uncharacterized membrane protein YfcA